LVELAVFDKVVRQKANSSKSSSKKAHGISFFKLAFWTQKALLKSFFTKHPN